MDELNFHVNWNVRRKRPAYADNRWMKFQGHLDNALGTSSRNTARHLRLPLQINWREESLNWWTTGSDTEEVIPLRWKWQSRAARSNFWQPILAGINEINLKKYPREMMIKSHIIRSFMGKFIWEVVHRKLKERKFVSVALCWGSFDMRWGNGSITRGVGINLWDEKQV